MALECEYLLIIHNELIFYPMQRFGDKSKSACIWLMQLLVGPALCYTRQCAGNHGAFQ